MADARMLKIYGGDTPKVTMEVILEKVMDILATYPDHQFRVKHERDDRYEESDSSQD